MPARPGHPWPVAAQCQHHGADTVIIQVAYFKASGGRRVFKMTPIHYTFHLEGWSENRIALSFWGVGLAAALASAWVGRTLA